METTWIGYKPLHHQQQQQLSSRLVIGSRVGMHDAAQVSLYFCLPPVTTQRALPELVSHAL